MQGAFSEYPMSGGLRNRDLHLPAGRFSAAILVAEVTFNLVAAVTESKDYTDAQLASYSDTAAMNQAIADALASAALSNGQSWTGGPTFNLLKGTTVLRNLSVAGALTATFQNLDDTILIESDSYARSETYTQLETGAAITAALDALNLSQYRTEAQVLALIAGELVPDWGLELRGGRADQLRNECLRQLQHQLGPVEL